MKSIKEFINEALNPKYNLNLISKGLWHAWCENVYNGNYNYKSKGEYPDPVTGKPVSYDVKMDTFAMAKDAGAEQAAADLLVSSNNESWKFPVSSTNKKICIPSEDDFKNFTNWILKFDDKDIAEDIAANYLAGFEELLDDLAKYIHLHHPSIEKMFVLKKHFEHYQDYYKKLGNNESHKESMQVLVAMWKPLLNFLGIDVNKVAAGDYSELPDYKDSLNKLVSKYPALKKYGL